MNRLGFVVGPAASDDVREGVFTDDFGPSNLDKYEYNWARRSNGVYQDKLKYISPGTSPVGSSNSATSYMNSRHRSNSKPRHASALSFSTDVKVVPIPSRNEVRNILFHIVKLFMLVRLKF